MRKSLRADQGLVTEEVEAAIIKEVIGLGGEALMRAMQMMTMIKAEAVPEESITIAEEEQIEGERSKCLAIVDHSFLSKPLWKCSMT
jgi:hypothetical protein